MAFWKCFCHKRSVQEYKPVILITGCSSGIGLALARLLRDQLEYRVVITARSQSLERLRAENFHETDRFWMRPLDVVKAGERDRLVHEIGAAWGGVDILVNNAGISYRAVVEHMDEQSELYQMATNYLGPMALIRAVLPQMRERGRGKIINVSSVSGMLAMPTMSSYSASKYALEGASEALWYEMRPLGINVTLVQPGFIRSNSFHNVYHSKVSRAGSGENEPYGDYYANMAPFIEHMMNWSLTTPEKVARIILKVIQKEKPPLRIPATFDAYVFYHLRRFIPQRLFHPILFALLPHARKWGQAYTNARIQRR